MYALKNWLDIFNMDPYLNTFLSHSEFQAVCNQVSKYVDEITKLPKDKRIKAIKQIFEFQKIFKTDSVQGLAGIATIDTHIPLSKALDIHDPHEETISENIVFKVSIEINRSIEHEYYVLKKLNKLRPYCPNFVGALGMLPAYVPRDFFEDNDHFDISSNIFDVKKNPVQTNYLLLEYVSDMTCRHIWKYAHKGTVTGIILGVLCALQIAQNKLKFVHYDLHSGNILMKRIEDDAYFAYIIDGKVIMYPTFGWYPVMIDMGSSYIEGIEERPTRTTVAHYHRGLQPTVFDPVSDVHHFLLSAVSRLEKADTQSEKFRTHFRILATRMMHNFRHSDIWRYNGWKQLPVNLLHKFNTLINKTKAEICDFYRDVRTPVVETITLGVKLPWKQLSQDELQSMLKYYYPSLTTLSVNDDVLMLLLKHSVEDINHFLNVLDNDSLTKTDTQILYALRALVEHASLIEPSGTVFDVSKETINVFKQVTQSMFPTYSYKLSFLRSFRGAIVLCKLMCHLYHEFNQENIEKMEYGHTKNDVKKPLDVIDFLQQNTAIRRHYLPHSPIYIWDSDRERHIKTTFDQCKIFTTSQVSNKQMEQLVLDFAQSYTK